MKSRRQYAIRDILNSGRVATQEELCEALKNRGFKVTQATVSRDIKELGLIKVADGAGYRYSFAEMTSFNASHERISRILKEMVKSVDYSGNIVMVRTMPGAAQSVGSLIDSMSEPSILGNVAGDDTVIVVVKPEDQAEKVSLLLQGILAS